MITERMTALEFALKMLHIPVAPSCVTPLNEWVKRHGKAELQNAQLATILCNDVQQVGVYEPVALHNVASFFASQPCPQGLSILRSKVGTNLRADIQLAAGEEPATLDHGDTLEYCSTSDGTVVAIGPAQPPRASPL